MTLAERLNNSSNGVKLLVAKTKAYDEYVSKHGEMTDEEHEEFWKGMDLVWYKMNKSEIDFLNENLDELCNI